MRQYSGRLIYFYYLCDVIKREQDMHTYKVTMQERQPDGSIRTLTQTAVCTNKSQVIEWYGLTEPDIVDYTIETIN